MHSKIIISSDFNSVKDELIRDVKPNFLRIFEYDNFLVDDAKEIINEAYIAEIEEKVIVIMAFKFGIEPQNALLKILEEPPKNSVFILVAPSKNSLLPTIRSRLMIENRKLNLQRAATGLNLKKLELKDIYNFIEQSISLEKVDKLNKTSLLNLVKSIVCEAIDSGASFSAEDYRYFYKIYRLVDLNAKSTQVLTPLLLLIMQRMR
ncbi:DNA polymerase III subunit delta' [Campylobacter fetus]|uniref:DNA polymerase III subunit delta n=1 Tax=Campylobacter fetus subsp. testudinum TaxID=1507806 RepID=A0AAX0HD99_CAMFE|nr:DNA polymerase III subunit delta' [Campylobacter fetus]ALV65117.1 DNA polymerase III, delta prime subunit [Campylobacter fetus subsp. testudinum Sp3]OCR85909.1 DNA polymerase III subunit delta' [Campylobacter fetus subsp. testudinum]OCR88527.1 DNA polymerase III subunit delta' [Campylobacter fetus subsp. testudinum]OCR88691.1 DNA polymerase III subunit delta' [Campylobacter fetus subsp. testudinum]OCR91594.1 DNA polymerase III subunit delta' [Campylobacter fetus subsp. testudinum]